MNYEAFRKHFAELPDKDKWVALMSYVSLAAHGTCYRDITRNDLETFVLWAINQCQLTSDGCMINRRDEDLVRK